MTVHEFGNPEADIVLVQAVDEHDPALIESEIKAIRESSTDEFRLIALEVDDWNADLSPWREPAVFGNADFGDGAANTLCEVKKLCADGSKTYFIGGYSLAGLFALWAAHETDIFKGVAAASPSIWFPGFSEYMKEHKIQSASVYLSLGDREEKTRNPVMSTVGGRIREAYGYLKENGIDCVLEWNQGNHFKDAVIRTAKAFAWVMSRQNKDL